MIKIRKATDRGFAQNNWLTSYHTFSFSSYYDPNFMSFSNLRVINEDIIQPGNGFGFHPHKNMEIITYMIKGELQHEDSMGNKKTIKEGEVQVMSAGSGVMHSEVNPSTHNPAHLLQIWVIPHSKDITPRYEQQNFPMNEVLTLALSPDAQKASFKIYQDVFLYIGKLENNKEYEFEASSSRKYWVQLISGTLEVNSQSLSPGDAAIIENESLIEFKTKENAHFLLFDLN